ncbi:hypothetical protein [Amnibacterium kyonggiense]
MRRSLTVLAPIAAGAVVLALAVAYPASAVHGSGLTGPVVPKSFANVPLGSAYRARWADHDRVVLLRVRDGAACEPTLRRAASTGPARLEVSVARPAGPDCLAHRRWWGLDLTPPPIRARHQAVAIFVNGAFTSIGPPAH